MIWMIPTILRNVLARPATRRYPTETREPFEGTRGRLEIDGAGCVYCGACARKCPSNALHVDHQLQQMTFEPYRCVVCGACVDACTKNSLRIVGEHKHPETTKPILMYSSHRVNENV